MAKKINPRLKRAPGAVCELITLTVWDRPDGVNEVALEMGVSRFTVASIAAGFPIEPRSYDRAVAWVRKGKG